MGDQSCQAQRRRDQDPAGGTPHYERAVARGDGEHHQCQVDPGVRTAPRGPGEDPVVQQADKHDEEQVPEKAVDRVAEGLEACRPVIQGHQDRGERTEETDRRGRIRVPRGWSLGHASSHQLRIPIEKAIQMKRVHAAMDLDALQHRKVRVVVGVELRESQLRDRHEERSHDARGEG